MDHPITSKDSGIGREEGKNQPVEHGRLCSGPTNAEILGDAPDAYPPTLNEVGFSFHPRPPIIEHFLNPVRDAYYLMSSAVLPRAWDNSKEFGSMRFFYQFNEKLPTSVQSGHDVYVISKFQNIGVASLQHWSFYTQGHFFHLSAPLPDKSARRQGDKFRSQSRDIPVSLKHENFSTLDSVDSVRCRETPSKVGLLAYQVGKTTYNLDSILRLATWMIGAMQTYDLFGNNCQKFVFSMALRTIMTTRDCSLFVGTASQIANWDLNGRQSGQRFYDYEHGFLLFKPRTDIPPDRPRYSPTGFLAEFRRHRRARLICKLYRYGPGYRLFDPQGIRSPTRYMAHAIAQDFRQDWQEILRANREMIEDFKAGRWRDAWVGRHETRLEEYTKWERRREANPGITSFSFTRRLWCLSKEDVENI